MDLSFAPDVRHIASPVNRVACQSCTVMPVCASADTASRLRPSGMVNVFTAETAQSFSIGDPSVTQALIKIVGTGKDGRIRAPI
jgi:hypothetical protein